MKHCRRRRHRRFPLFRESAKSILPRRKGCRLRPRLGTGGTTWNPGRIPATSGFEPTRGQTSLLAQKLHLATSILVFGPPQSTTIHLCFDPHHRMPGQHSREGGLRIALSSCGRREICYYDSPNNGLCYYRTPNVNIVVIGF
jgi:hypothetical protein